MSDKLDRQAARERIASVFPKCKACRGNGIISVKVGRTFETDSAEESRLAYRDVPCPHCDDRKNLRLALAELEAQDATIASQAAEIAELKRVDLIRRQAFVADAKQWAVESERQSALIQSMREEQQAYRVTREIERQFDLLDRLVAVQTAVHAIDYLNSTQIDHSGSRFVDRMNAMTILRDGITNAIDGRSTGLEFNTIRHSTIHRQDPQHAPMPTEADRRCQQCGAISPPHFSHCRNHRPAPTAALAQVSASPQAQEPTP